MKNKKKIWIISFLCAGAGILIMILGILLGGQPGFYFDSNGVHASGEVIKESYTEDKQELDEFTSIDIDLSYADLEIIPSDKYAVEYRLDGPKKPVCTVKSGKLVFKEAGIIGPYMNFGFTIPVAPGYGTEVYVRLYVPEKTEFDTIRIAQEDGDIKLPVLKAENMHIANEYGDLEIEKFEGKKLNIELQDGSFSSGDLSADTVQIENEYGNIDIKDVNGKTLEAVLDDGTFTADNLEADSVRIENEYGNVNFGLSRDIRDYAMDLTTEYGSITMPGYEEFNGDEGARRKVEGKSGKQIKVICQDGDINLKSTK